MPPLDIEQYLYAAQLGTGVSADRLRRQISQRRLLAALQAPVELVDGRPLHTTLSARAAVMAARLSASRLLHDRDSDVAVMAMVIFLELNGCDAALIVEQHAQAVVLLERVVFSELSEEEYAAWVAEWIDPDRSGEEGARG